MSQELHYTSVPRGLKPGSRGFGAVGVTADLPDLLAERFESLSGYQAVYPPGDPSAALNPVVLRACAVDHGWQGARRAVADRPGGPRLLRTAEQVCPPCGPGRQRAAGRRPRLVAGPAGIPPIGLEGRATDPAPGAAGPARRPARRHRRSLACPDRRRRVGRRSGRVVSGRPPPARLPGLPAGNGPAPPVCRGRSPCCRRPRRWEVEFSTYFTTLPQGVTCHWRGRSRGSAEAKNARRLPNALIVDLCRPAGRARGDALVHLARTGERLEASRPRTVSRHQFRGGSPCALDRRPPTAPHRRARPHREAGSPRRSESSSGPRRATGAIRAVTLRRRSGPATSSAAHDPRRDPLAACLVPLIAASLIWSPVIRKQLGIEPATSRAALGSARCLPVNGRIPWLPPEEWTRSRSRGGDRRQGAPDPGSQSHPDGRRSPGGDAEIRGEGGHASESPAPKPSTPIANAPPAGGPLIVAFALPDIPRSQFGGPVRKNASSASLKTLTTDSRSSIAGGLRVVPPADPGPGRSRQGRNQPSRQPIDPCPARPEGRAHLAVRLDERGEQALDRADTLRDAVLRFRPATDVSRSSPCSAPSSLATIGHCDRCRTSRSCSTASIRESGRSSGPAIPRP